MGTLPATWQEALEKHPIADVRAFEKQLRASALRDREKLRALVGSNYRELLHTAERIIALDQHVHHAESDITRLSQACKPPERQETSTDVSKIVQTASQLQLTDQLIRRASKAVKEKSVLFAARYFVIARLLLQYLGQTHGTDQTLHWLQARHKTLRRQSLTSINHVLLRPTSKAQALCSAAAAYCLITSSSAADAIEHLQSLRTQRLSQKQSEDSPQTHTSIEKGVLAKCHYLINSVSAIRTLSGRRLSEQLSDVQKRPLLEDESFSDTRMLHLDGANLMLPADVLSFTPYFKRTLPTTSEIRVICQTWMKQNFRHLLTDIERSIQDVGLAVVLRIRDRVLNVLLPNIFTSFFAPVMDELRDCFSKRIMRILEESASRIVVLADNLDKIVMNHSHKSFWDTETTNQVRSLSSSTFLRRIRHDRLGVDRDLDVRLVQLRKWSVVCSKIQEHLDSLSRIRWQDKIEEYDDDDEDEALSIVSRLSKVDPQTYRAHYDRALSSSAGRFIEELSHRAEKLSGVESDTGNPDATSVLLRICREARLVIGKLAAEEKIEALKRSTDLLQEAFVHSTAGELFVDIEGRNVSGDLTFSAEDLPSPLTISVLKGLCELMHRTGGLDLWTPLCVQQLRRIVRDRALSSEHESHYTRNNFDKAYLSAAMGQAYEDIDENVARKATNYWNRTKALFGNIAG